MAREPTGMNIYGETMAQYYQRRAHERGAEIEDMLTVMQSAVDSLINDNNSLAEKVLSACLKKYGR